MEPRSLERGNQSRQCRKRSPHTASMEPRSLERGNMETRNEQEQGANIKCFNGAAFSRTRKQTTPVAGRIHVGSRLQWSHVLSNAETSYGYERMRIQSELQWSRVLSNAETGLCSRQRCWTRLQWSRVLSNAETMQTFVPESTTATLQWSRVLSNAETLAGLTSSSYSMFCFNGAAFSRTRKPFKW